ncbi:MAG: hypothetical protein IPG21_05245 [Saprospiraceae bacterium]|nr:hypothetical protein [Candidatus Vicinibacter affinis]
MIADENCTLEKKRIIIAPKETGYEWAKNFANTESNKEKLLFLKEKITKRKIPLGVLERFERITDEQERLLLLLQTIHNHYQAKENSGADISIEIDE